MRPPTMPRYTSPWEHFTHLPAWRILLRQITKRAKLDCVDESIGFECHIHVSQLTIAEVLVLQAWMVSLRNIVLGIIG